MIVLSNGDKWVLDDSEWKDAGIEYKEARKGNLPITDTRESIKILCAYYSKDDHPDAPDFMCPRKLTNEFGGYWDANYSALSEILGDVALRELNNDWSHVYEMSWGEVIVVYEGSDGGYDAAVFTKTFNSYEEYHKAVSIKEHQEKS